MRILICDDNVEIINQLESYIRKYFSANKAPMPEIVSYQCGDDVLEKEESVDFAFLDVEMPGRNGIFTGKYLMDAKIAIPAPSARDLSTTFTY